MGLRMTLYNIGGWLVAGLLLTQPVSAATYYADSACAVQGDGTSADCASGIGEAGAFAIITEGLSKLQPGDVLQLAAGTYDQRIVIQVNTNAPEGTEGDPIVIRGAGTSQTIVRGDDLDEPTVLIERSYWTLEELTVQNGEAGDPEAEGGCIKVRKQISGVVLRKLVVDGQKRSAGGIRLSCLDWGTTCPQGTLIEDVLSHDHLRASKEDAHCVSLNYAKAEEYGIADTVIRRMTAWGCSGDGVQIIGDKTGGGFSAINTVIEDCTFYREYDMPDEENAIDLKGARGVIIRGNTMHGFRPTKNSLMGAVVMIHHTTRDVMIENNIIYGGGQNIRISKGKYELDGHPTNIIIRNNIIYNATKIGAGDGPDGKGNGITIAEATNIKLLHNTIVESEGAGIEVTQSAAEVLLQGNLVVGSGADAHELSVPNSGNVTASHNLIWGNDGPGTVKGVADLSSACPTCLNADPIFVDREGHDFHLAAGSPAIDAGESMDEVVTDQEGRVRDDIPDLGALEFVSSSTPPGEDAGDTPDTVEPSPDAGTTDGGPASSGSSGCVTARTGAPTGHLPVWMLTALGLAWLIRRRLRAF